MSHKPKLWLDDVRDPATHTPDPENWEWVKSYGDACRAVDENEYEHISFDFYLNANSMFPVPNGLDTAREVSRITKKKGRKPFTWDAHSSDDNCNDKINLFLKTAFPA